MNRLLQINKKLLFFILIGTILIFTLTIISNDTYISSEDTIHKPERPSFDIINPSFTINNKQKISVKAERGNFLSDQKILLEKNVVFKSSDFQLQTNRAMFNKSDQTARSKEPSKFQSENTIIVSEGFEITENGNVIFFTDYLKTQGRNYCPPVSNICEN